MTGRQIRWGSVGRAVAIAVAAIAGIASLPALLGSDRPPPLPPDVGLVPPQTAPAPPSVQAPPVASAPTPDPSQAGHRPAGRVRSRVRRHPPQPRHRPRRVAPDPPPPESPPVYSQSPPQPAGDNLGIER